MPGRVGCSGNLPPAQLASALGGPCTRGWGGIYHAAIKKDLPCEWICSPCTVTPLSHRRKGIVLELPLEPLKRIPADCLETCGDSGACLSFIMQATQIENMLEHWSASQQPRMRVCCSLRPIQWLPPPHCLRHNSDDSKAAVCPHFHHSPENQAQKIRASVQQAYGKTALATWDNLPVISKTLSSSAAVVISASRLSGTIAILFKKPLRIALGPGSNFSGRSE